MKRDLPIISLFSGALGLDLGLEGAGFRIAVALECNKAAAQTIRNNRPALPLIEKSIEEVATQELLKAANLKPGRAAIVTGGPSCQAFSTAGQRGSLADPRGVMFREFLRVVREAQPQFFLMENVPGVLSAAIRHRPLSRRGPGHPRLKPDEELGSAFAQILRELRRLRYYVVFDLLNAADFGVPQTRERIVFMGSRDGRPITIPKRTHSRVSTNGLRPWVTLGGGLAGLEDPVPVFAELSQSKKRYLSLVPAGGNWRDLPKGLQEEALGGAYRSWGGRNGFFRRLSWDKPAPALTTRPDSKATMACHPIKLRPLTVRECARLQQFPDSWLFAGARPQQYVQVGNAVPLGLGEALGGAILSAIRGRAERTRLGVVICPNKDLVQRIQKRPRTILNPPRMRESKGVKALRRWLGHGRKRLPLLRLLKAGNDKTQAPVGQKERSPSAARSCG